MCEQLGLRLYNEQNTTTNTNNSATNNAILCYICSGNIQRTVDLWSQELRVSARDPSTGNLNSNLLQNYIEKVTIFTSINNNPPTSTTNTTNNASNINLPIECSEYFTQYAMLIAAQGQFDLALSFLKGNSIGESILMDRLYHASSTATSTTSKSGGGVGGKVPVFPFERVNVNAVQGLTSTTTNTAATATTAAGVKPVGVGVAATATTSVQQGGVQRGGGFTPQQPVAQPAVATTPAAQVLAPGWAQSTDPASGRVYYFNQATGQSQWEAPLVAAAPTPAPQPIPQPVQQQQPQLQQPNMYHRHPTVGPGVNTDPAFAQPQPAFAQPYSPPSQIHQQPLGGYPSQQPQAQAQMQPQYQQQQAYQPIQQQQPQQPRIGSFPSAIPGPGPTSAFGTGPSPSTFQPQPVPTAAAAPIPQPVPVPEPKVLLPDSEGVLLLEQVINAVAGIYIYAHLFVLLLMLTLFHYLY